MIRLASVGPADGRGHKMREVVVAGDAGGHLSLAQAAMRSGFSIELIESLIAKCPKPGQKRLLKSTEAEGIVWIAERDLDSYVVFLEQPWPKPAKGRRPHVPIAIRSDVKRECHHQCAICGDMNNAELAHIKAVADSYNNSPNNLILLCPNHHTEYDFGFRPSSNIDEGVVEAAKLVKRASRKRVLRFEGNVFEQLHSVLEFVARASRKLVAPSDQLRAVYAAELTALIEEIPSLVIAAEEDASHDKAANADLRAVAPALGEAASAWLSTDRKSFQRSLPDIAEQIVNIAAPVLHNDSVACPHCAAVGWSSGHLCPFCGGDQHVPPEVASEYDPTEFEMVDCPVCSGSGERGIGSNPCLVCEASGKVTRAVAANIDTADFDLVECPHCNGSGTGGWNGLCDFCGGDQHVPPEVASEYDPTEFEMVDCPVCSGSGERGIGSNPCLVCEASGKVTRAVAANIDTADFDLVECPHCNGSGTGGWNGLCDFCGGDQHVPPEVASEYDPTEFEMVDCPVCSGSGERGIGSNPCLVCEASGKVTRAVAENIDTADF